MRDRPSTYSHKPILKQAQHHVRIEGVRKKNRLFISAGAATQLVTSHICNHALPPCLRKRGPSTRADWLPCAVRARHHLRASSYSALAPRRQPRPRLVLKRAPRFVDWRLERIESWRGSVHCRLPWHFCLPARCHGTRGQSYLDRQDPCTTTSTAHVLLERGSHGYQITSAARATENSRYGISLSRPIPTWQCYLHSGRTADQWGAASSLFPPSVARGPGIFRER